MKKLIVLFLLLFLWVSSVSATSVDNSIEEELDKLSSEAKEVNKNFSLQTFSSCKAMDDVMEDYIKDYWKNNKNRFYYGYEEALMLDDIAFTLWDIPNAEADVVADITESKAVSDKDFSKTNTQVQWVDESDIVKTDWKYVYYYNQEQKSVYIIDAQSSSEVKVLKKIKIPKILNNTQLYIDEERLVITGWWYIHTNKNNVTWYNRSQKTVTVVYDTSKISEPKLLKMYVSDGASKKTRKIGDILYVLSNNSFSIPYYDFKNEDDISFSSESAIPQALELTASSDKQNTVVNNKRYPFTVKSGNIVDCNEISYSLPDKDALSNVGFAPNYNIISAINIRDTEKSVQTDVIAGNNSEIYMSMDNLYMTESQYMSYDFRCAPWMMCIQPFFYRGTHTLIHKLNIDWQNVDYQTSALIPWSPLTQYSMDEYNNNFRIITQHYHPERSTSVYILDDNLKMKSSLGGLWKTEDFKSSRFMWDKLFLVTFQQIDPFYVIDLSNDTDPKVLWELKIPGYSTYLHPYDENHIIWIGYDTVENKWWGTMNAGLKIDLYEIDYNREPLDFRDTQEYKDCRQKVIDDLPKDSAHLMDPDFSKCESLDVVGEINLWDIYVAQKFTKTIWDNGTYSEALSNPRMFMWNSSKNTLLLPITEKISSPNDHYKIIDYFQWMYSFDIDAQNGISQNYKISHLNYDEIQDERNQECKKYSQDLEQQVCKTLIDGTQYCTKTTSTYIPSYCYIDSTIWEYLSRNSYKYSHDFIKRALWVWDRVITISDSQLQVWNLTTGKSYWMVEMK